MSLDTPDQQVQPAQGWFHCARCGALYSAPTGSSSPGSCPECGTAPGSEPPSPESRHGEGVRRVRKKRRSPSSGSDEDGLERPSSSSKKKRRRNSSKARMLATAAGVWVAVLAISAVVILTSGEDAPSNGDIGASQAPKVELTYEDSNLLRDNAAEITGELNAFIVDSSPASRAVHVLHPQRSIGRMTHTRDVASNVPFDGTPSLLDRGVSHPLSGPVVETLWGLSENRQIEAIFRQEEGHWKLDWDEYARYSPDYWPEFLVSTGDGEGEFRLFARLRASAGPPRVSEFGLVLSMPRFGHPGETLNSSPPIYVKKDSDIGVRLLAAFENRKKNEGAFGSHLVKHDPEDQIRVHVKMSRTGEEDKKVFTITELMACHWLDLDEAGNRIEDPEEAKH